MQQQQRAERKGSGLRPGRQSRAASEGACRERGPDNLSYLMHLNWQVGLGRLVKLRQLEEAPLLRPRLLAIT